MKRLEEMKALMCTLVVGVMFVLYSARQKSPEEKVQVKVLSLDSKAFVFSIPSKVLKSDCTMFNVAEAVRSVPSPLIVVTEPYDLEYFALATSFSLEGITRPVIFTVNDKVSVEGAYADLQKGLVPGVYKRTRDRLYYATGQPYNGATTNVKETYLPINPEIGTAVRKIYPGLNIGDIDAYADVLFIDGTPDDRVLQASKILVAKSKERNTLICYTGVSRPVKTDFPCLYTHHHFELAYVKLLWLLSNAGKVDITTLQKLLEEQSLRMEV